MCHCLVAVQVIGGVHLGQASEAAQPGVLKLDLKSLHFRFQLGNPTVRAIPAPTPLSPRILPDPTA
jgi:hypothetical protein